MIGDEKNMLERQKSLIPAGWFADVAPIRHAILGGLGTSLSWIYGFIGYAKAQTRIKTATGFILDLIAWDFFGARFLRRRMESDDSFRPRILKEILRPRQTRAAIIQALTDLTGRVPLIYEAWNPADAGGYGIGTLAYGGSHSNAGRVGGYGIPLGGYGQGSDAYFIPTGVTGSFKGAGFYGSLQLPNQIFITAFRPASAGIPLVAGYGAGPGGYGRGTIEYADLSLLTPLVSDADIYACVANTVAAGITAWVAIEN